MFYIRKRGKMSFSSHIFASCAKTTALLLMAALTFSYADKPLKGKVRYKVGEVNRQEAKQDDWKPLRQGANVKEADKIKTEKEAQATIAFPDGSILSVEENSLVEIKILSSDDGGSQHAMADIKEGKIKFNAQTQGIGNTLQFRTGTATAAIRGTDGVIAALSDNQSLFSLATGLMALSIDNSKEEELKPQQTAISIPKRFGKNEKFAFFKAASSGNITFINDIIDVVEKNMKEASSYEEWFKNIDKALSEADKNFQQKVEKIKSSLNCEFENLPDSIFVPSVLIKGHCNSKIKMEINGEVFEEISSEFQNQLNWEDVETASTKKVLINCTDIETGVGLECGRLSTFFMPTLESMPTQASGNMAVAIQQPIEVDDDGFVNIEGKYDPNNIESIVISIGNKKTTNLVSKTGTGEFYASIPVNDEIGNWDESAVQITYIAKNGEEKKESLDLSVDKSKKAVNIAGPKMRSIFADSISKCVSKIDLSGVKGDQVILSTFIDGTPISEKRYTDNAKITTTLKPGKHSYSFIATDMAGNKQELNMKMGCYALSSGKISVSGNAVERLRVPPPPNGVDPDLHKTLKFKIENIPGQDPDYIKRVTVKKGDKIIFRQQSQFEDINFDIPVELNRSKSNVFKIEVVLKNRSVLTATKTYEVR